MDRELGGRFFRADSSVSIPAIYERANSVLREKISHRLGPTRSDHKPTACPSKCSKRPLLREAARQKAQPHGSPFLWVANSYHIHGRHISACGGKMSIGIFASFFLFCRKYSISIFEPPSRNLSCSIAFEAANCLKFAIARRDAFANLAYERGSSLRRLSAMMWMALSVARSPPLFKLCRTAFPDEAGTGLTPHNAANFASEFG